MLLPSLVGASPSGGAGKSIMVQLFPPRVELVVKLVAAAIGLSLLALLVLAVWRARADLLIGKAIAQPIPFSHKHHVGDDGIDCRYCHVQVETGAFAGMPSTRTCLTCHSQLYRDAPMLAPLHESARSGRPIAWRRVHDLPDFVYFDHSIHVARGVACQQCHGRVDQMPLTWRVSPLQMQWCLQCHRDPRPQLRTPDRVFEMLDPPAAQAAHAGAREAAHVVALDSRRRMTDCSTCHR